MVMLPPPATIFVVLLTSHTAPAAASLGFCVTGVGVVPPDPLVVAEVPRLTIKFNPSSAASPVSVDWVNHQAWMINVLPVAAVISKKSCCAVTATALNGQR